jgi:hypothetical protein
MKNAYATYQTSTRVNIWEIGVQEDEDRNKDCLKKLKQKYYKFRERYYCPSTGKSKVSSQF